MVSKNPETSIPVPSRNVSIIFAGSLGIEFSNAAVISALSGNKISLVNVENPYILPYMVQKVIKQNLNDVIVAVAVVVGVHEKNLNSALIPSLLQIGLQSSIPVIPSVLQCDNILELKALLPSFAKSWSSSIDAVLGPIKTVPISTVEVVSKPNKKSIEQGVDLSVNDLIEDFRRSLQVCHYYFSCYIN